MARKKSLNPILQATIVRAIALYVRLVNAMTRWQVVGKEPKDVLAETGQPVLIVLWHARILMVPTMMRFLGKPLTVLVSEHRDGALVDGFVRRFDIKTARGSTSHPKKRHKNKRGGAAMKALLDDARAGNFISLTPDGPRGPRQVAQLGAVQLARLGGLQVIPMSYSIARARRLRTWDRFLLPLPLPFSRGSVVFGEPISVTARGDEAMEAARLEIEAALNDVSDEADRLVGLTPLPRPVAASLSTATQATPEIATQGGAQGAAAEASS